MAKVEKRGKCWIWTAGVNGRGRPSFALHRSAIRADFFSYSTFVAELPEDHTLIHTCGKHRCVNPDHLKPEPRMIP